MIGDSFTVNDKSYTIKNLLTLGEHRKINNLNAKLNRLNNEIKIETDENKKNQLSSELMVIGNDQLEVICDFLEKHLGVTQENINELSLDEAIQVFQEAYIKLSTVDKNIKKT